MGPGSTGSALALGIGLSPDGGAGGHAPGSILDIDIVRGAYWDGSTAYPDEAAFLAAVGGSVSGGKYVIGPCVAPGAPELVPNGGFAADVGGWTASQNAGGPASIAWSSGELQLTGNAADTGFACQAVTVEIGHAYRLSGDIRKVSGSVGPTLGVTFSQAKPGSASNYAVSSFTTATTPQSKTLYFTHWATTAYVGEISFQNPMNGVVGLDNVSAVEVLPFAGFTPADVSGVIEATTPASASGDKIVLQLDDAATSSGAPVGRNYLRLVWKSDTHLHLVVHCQTANGTHADQADLDLGAVAVSTPFQVSFSAAVDAFSASLDGGTAVTGGSGKMPGMAALRLGQGQAAGTDWDGAIGRVTLY